MPRGMQMYADVNPDAPKVCVHSIPHTGTRFVIKFFESHGTPVWHRHLYDKQNRPEWKRIIPVRSPYDCWKSWTRRRRREFTDLDFVAIWGEFIMRTEHQDAFYFPLDIDPLRRQMLLMDAVDYIGADRDMEFIKAFAKKWQPRGASARPHEREAEELPGDVENALRFAHEWYRHYTMHWGEHVRNDKTMIGEAHGWL